MRVVLDTNVLLHDPQSIYKFEDNNLAIPVEVLEELDAIKGEQSTERGRNARRVHRILQELLPDSRSMHEGVKLPNGGTLSVIINRYLVENNWSSPASPSGNTSTGPATGRLPMALSTGRPSIHRGEALATLTLIIRMTDGAPAFRWYRRDYTAPKIRSPSLRARRVRPLPPTPEPSVRGIGRAPQSAGEAGPIPPCTPR